MQGSIPVLNVEGYTIAKAYENALIALWQNGIEIKSQYDKPDDLPTIDSSMSIIVENPMCDPMIHKAFPGGIADLREYVYELQGLKDKWIRNENDPNDKRWDYTYHGRFADYAGNYYLLDKRVHESGFNQIETVIEQLIKTPYTRRAQMITWEPFIDPEISDPPCIQSLWYRMIEAKNEFILNCDVRIRSNDAWGANFMNMFGITMFNRTVIADEIEKRTGKKANIGRLWWVADSYHIYGRDQKAFKERFFDRLSKTDFVDRVFFFNHPSIQEMWKECEPEILKKINDYNEANK
jgi:thymidylate synthase